MDDKHRETYNTCIYFLLLLQKWDSLTVTDWKCWGFIATNLPSLRAQVCKELRQWPFKSLNNATYWPQTSWSRTNLQVFLSSNVRQDISCIDFKVKSSCVFLFQVQWAYFQFFPPRTWKTQQCNDGSKWWDETVFLPHPTCFLNEVSDGRRSQQEVAVVPRGRWRGESSKGTDNTLRAVSTRVSFSLFTVKDLLKIYLHLFSIVTRDIHNLLRCPTSVQTGREKRPNWHKRKYRMKNVHAPTSCKTVNNQTFLFIDSPPPDLSNECQHQTSCLQISPGSGYSGNNSTLISAGAMNSLNNQCSYLDECWLVFKSGPLCTGLITKSRTRLETFITPPVRSRCWQLPPNFRRPEEKRVPAHFHFFSPFFSVHFFFSSSISTFRPQVNRFGGSTEILNL